MKIMDYARTGLRACGGKARSGSQLLVKNRLPQLIVELACQLRLDPDRDLPSDFPEHRPCFLLACGIHGDRPSTEGFNSGSCPRTGSQGCSFSKRRRE
jgi:hypothetical protein